MQWIKEHKWTATIIAAIVAFCMIHPGLRRVIWFILPFGSGWDDVLFIVAMIVIFVVWWANRYSNNPYNRKR